MYVKIITGSFCERAALARRMVDFFKDIVAGVRYGYPLCCVIDYSLIALAGLPPAAVKAHFELKGKKCFDGHVLCERCYLKNQIDEPS